MDATILHASMIRKFIIEIGESTTTDATQQAFHDEGVRCGTK